jgi:hypothetical protein
VGEKLVLSRGSLSSSLSTSQFMQAAVPVRQKTHDRPLEKAFREQPGCSLVLCLLYLSTVVIHLLLRTRHEAVVVDPERNDIGGCQTQHV